MFNFKSKARQRRDEAKSILESGGIKMKAKANVRQSTWKLYIFSVWVRTEVLYQDGGRKMGIRKEGEVSFCTVSKISGSNKDAGEGIRRGHGRVDGRWGMGSDAQVENEHGAYQSPVHLHLPGPQRLCLVELLKTHKWFQYTHVPRRMHRYPLSRTFGRN